MHTEVTNTPEQEIGFVRPTFDEELVSRLGVALYEGITVTEGQRKLLDETLDYWNDMAEMNVEPQDEPWPDAPSLCVPIVPLAMEAVSSRLSSAVFVPRMYVISPLTPEAQPHSHATENYYNAEWRRQHWMRPHRDCLDLSIRDGAGIMEVLWERRKVTQNVVTMEPTGETGEDGKQKKVKRVQTVDIMAHNGPRLTPVELRDFFLLPAAARSLQEASAVYRRLYLTETQLREMCEGDNPTLQLDLVEKMLEYHSVGQSDLPSDPEGTATYEQGGTLQVGGTGTMDIEDADGESIRERGLFSVWRIHTREYDLDKDGVCEENVLYLGHQSQQFLGGGPYEYWMRKRPFVKFAIMPRVLRFQGFSVPERERSFQESANQRKNQRAAALDLKIAPPLDKTAGVKTLTKEGKWGPGITYEVTSKGDIGIIDIGTMDPASIQEEMFDFRYAMQIVGIEAPTLPVQGNQKMSQRQQQAQQTGSNVRLDLMALELRLSCEEVLQMVHALNLQYGDDDMENDLGGHGVESIQHNREEGPKKFKLPYEALAQDYSLAVAGTEGALDKENRRGDVMTLYALLLQNPLVMGNLEHVYEVTSMVLDDYNMPEYTRFIGTKEDAKKLQEAQAQAAQKAHDEEMALQIASHSKNDKGSGGAPQMPAPQPQPGPESNFPANGMALNAPPA
jgi:hypothetical protein